VLELTELVERGLKRFDCAAIRAREFREGGSKEPFTLQEIFGCLL